MSARGLLAKSKLQEFKSWLEQNGFVTLELKGNYEVLRWKGKAGRPLPIIFRRESETEHFTCNNAAAPFVRRWLREREE